MKKSFFIFILILVSTVIVFAQTAVTRKVLLVGLDGVQLEEISKTYAPNLGKFNMRKAYSGGVAGTETEQVTGSGPGWVTILTGVWQNEHQVINNDSKTYKSQVPSLFSYVHNNIPNARIASLPAWYPINQFFEHEMEFVDYRVDGDAVKEGYIERDMYVTLKAVEEIKNNGPDFTFVHIDNPDEVGHRDGFGNAYLDSIQIADFQLGLLVDAVLEREKMSPTKEDWLIIVTTDHGREPSEGRSHGKQTEREKTIFIGMDRIWTSFYTSQLTTANQATSEENVTDDMYKTLNQTDIATLVLRHLRIER